MANNPEQQYEEKKKALLNLGRVYDRAYGKEPIGVFYSTVDDIEKLAISEGKRQKTLEVIGEIDKTKKEYNEMWASGKMSYDSLEIKSKSLEELKSKLKQQEE